MVGKGSYFSEFVFLTPKCTCYRKNSKKKKQPVKNKSFASFRWPILVLFSMEAILFAVLLFPLPNLRMGHVSWLFFFF